MVRAAFAGAHPDFTNAILEIMKQVGTSVTLFKRAPENYSARAIGHLLIKVGASK